MNILTAVFLLLFYGCPTLGGLVSICDGTGGAGERGVLGCVSFGGKYNFFQRAVCLSEKEISEDVRNNLRCMVHKKKMNPNCWYPCEVAAYDRHEGWVSELCKCNPDDKHKQSNLDNTCFIHTDINIGNCDWFTRCLEKKLKDVKCADDDVKFMVESGQRLCEANKKLFSELSPEKTTGLLNIQQCLQSPLMSLLFQKSSTICSSMVDEFKNRTRTCFKRLMTDWICDLPNGWFSNSRAKAYATMKSELTEILNEDVNIDHGSWWDFWKLPCDTKFVGLGVTNFLITIRHQKHEDIAAAFANSLDKALKWQERHVSKASNVFYDSGDLIFVELSIFPQQMFDFFSRYFQTAPDMAAEEEKVLLLVKEDPVPVIEGTGSFEILQVIKCTGSTAKCTEGEATAQRIGVSKCQAAGGSCMSNTGSCPGILIEGGMCTSDRKCCIKKDTDTVCAVIGGKCIDEFLMCQSGSIVKAKCGERKHCCLQFHLQRYTNDCNEPKIISRDSWGARKAVTENPTLRTPAPYFMVHNTAGSRCSGLKNCAHYLTAYQKYHIYEHGWRDLGYNFLIDDEGNVYEATGWGRRGIHSNNFNPYSHAASFFGNFNNEKPTKKATDALAKLVQCGVSKKYQHSDFRYLGHRDVRPANTDCPGFTFYKDLVTWERYTFTAVVSGGKIKDDKACEDAKGTCRDINVFPTCENGTYVEKDITHCIGHSNRKCCFPDQITAG